MSNVHVWQHECFKQTLDVFQKGRKKLSQNFQKEEGALKSATDDQKSIICDLLLLKFIL